MEENSNRQNVMKVWKDYTIKHAIVVIEKAMKAIKLKTVNFCWRKLGPNVVHDFTGFTIEPIKEIMKDIMDMAKKVGGRGSQDMDLGEIQDLIGITPEKLTEDHLMKMSAFKPDDEEEM